MRIVRRLAGALLVLAIVSYGLYQLMNARTFQLFGAITHRVDTEEQVVALTFDDGPTAEVRGLLDVLADHDAKATFFVVGHELEQAPEVGAAVVEAGHELGNHSWSHERLLLKSRSVIASEIERTDEVIRAAGQQGEILFRPPYGKKLFGLPRYLADNDRHTIMVDVEPESDPTVAADADRIVEHVVDRVRPGSIIVLHPMYDANELTRQALPDILEALSDEGFEIVTVSELLSRR